MINDSAKPICLISFFFFISSPVLAADGDAFYDSGEHLSIELVTIGPGDDINNFFGHNFLVVKDSSRGSATAYNYGAYHFNRKMLPSFIQGRLEFWVSTAPVSRAYLRYIYLNRSIHVQRLNLSSDQALFVANRLSHDALPENRYYLYHHFYNNCSTRLRDLLNTVIEGQLKKAFTTPARLTYREHAYRHTQHDILANTIIDFIMNHQVDLPITRYDEAFLPAELARQVAETSYVGQGGQHIPLVKKSYTIYSAKRPKTPRNPIHFRWLRFLCGLFIAFFAIASAWIIIRTVPHRRTGRFLLGILHVFFGWFIGLPGLLLFYMSSFTDHRVTYANENLLLANPLSFFALPLGFFITYGAVWAFKWSRAVFYILAVCSFLALIIKILPIPHQDNLDHIALILPINVGFALSHYLISRSRRFTSVPK